MPLREFGDKTNLKVSWNEESNLALLNKDNQNVSPIIVDEETAYIVCKTILESYCNKSLEYEKDNFEYLLNLSESENSWILRQYMGRKRCSLQQWLSMYKYCCASPSPILTDAMGTKGIFKPSNHMIGWED